MSFPRSHRTPPRRWRALGRALLLGAALLGAAPRAGAQASTSLTTSIPQSQLQFTPTLAGGAPPAQAVVVRAADNSVRENLAITDVRYESTGGTPNITGWATATLDRTTTPAVLTIRASSAGAPAAGGQFRVTYTLSATGATSTVVMATITIPPAKPTLVVGGNSSQSSNAVDLQLVPEADPRTATVEGAMLLTSSAERQPLEGLALSALNYDIGTGGWLTATLDTTRSPAVLRVVARRRVRDSTATIPPLDLAPGYHRVTFSITSTNGSNTPRLVVVRITVPSTTSPKGGVASLSMSGGTISTGANLSTRFVTQAGQRDPEPQLIRISNNNSGASFMSGVLAGAVAYGSGQPTGWLEVRQHGTTQGALLVLKPRLGGLAPGSYTATFPVTASNDAAAHTVSVRFDVQDPTPVLSLLDATTTNATVNARAPRLGALPAPEVVRVVNAGNAGSDREILQLALGQVTYTGGATGWLEAVLVDTAATTHVVLRARTTALARGSHTATVPVLGTGAGNSPRTITYQYVIDAASGPVLKLARDTARIDAAFATDATIQTVAVTNDGAGTLTGLTLDPVEYAAGEATGWLQARLDSATAPTAVQLIASHGALRGGTYTAYVTVRAPAGTFDSPKRLVVRFTVPPRATLAIDSSRVTMTATAGAADSVLRVLQVRNDGDAGSTLGALSIQSIGYNAGPEGWLQATLSATTAPATLALRARAGALAPGTYFAIVWVRSGTPGATDSPRRVDVVLEVTQQPVIALSTRDLPLQATVGGESPAAALLQVTNTGSGTLDGLAVQRVRDLTGASVPWLAATLDRSVAPAVLTLTPTTTELAAGLYRAHVVVGSSSAGVASDSVLVTLTVAEPQAVVRLSADSVVITVVTGGGRRDATVTVSNATGTALPALIAQATYEGGASGWLTTNLSASSAPTTLTIGATAGSLPQGVHVARVTVASGSATPAVVRVIVEVLDLPRSGAALVHATQLDAAERARLDRLGNNDGTYNLGDYLALRLRAGVDQ